MPRISNCRYTKFGPYYPCNVTTSGCSCAGNNVVNPVINEEYVFMVLTETTTVASGDIIPVALTNFAGNAITSTEAGIVNMIPGTYQATFNVTSEIGAGGENSFALSLNDTVISVSSTSEEGSVGSVSSVSNSIIFSVTENSTLSLINNGSDTVNVQRANLTVRKIN